MNDILTKEEAAELARVSVSTLMNLARQGELPAIQIGTRWLFVKSQLLDYFIERAKAEQVQRQEVPEAPRKRGRPANKIDLSKYQNLGV